MMLLQRPSLPRSLLFASRGSLSELNAPASLVGGDLAVLHLQGQRTGGLVFGRSMVRDCCCCVNNPGFLAAQQASDVM